MRYPATPGEFEGLMDFLEPVGRARHAPIARMLFLQVAVCPRCERPVRPCDPRRLVGDQLLHLACASDAGRLAEGKR